MSRLDEALRLTGQSARRKSTDGSEGVFVSAWGSEEAASTTLLAPGPARGSDPAHIAGRVSATAPVAAAEPALTHHAPVTLSSAWRERLAIAPEANPVLVEQYRRLAATLHRAQNVGGIKVIMLTSALPDDGKTLTAVNLALVLSESYRRRVLLIDADLRRPSLGNVADVTDASGLSEALRSPTEQKLALLQVTPTLMLLPAGRPDPDPMGGLTSARMRHILEEAAGRFDWVILDAPPLTPMADATLLSQMVDGAVFVVRAGRTQYPLVQKSIEALGRERILGVVLNGVQDLPAEQYGYHYAMSGDPQA